MLLDSACASVLEAEGGYASPRAAGFAGERRTGALVGLYRATLDSKTQLVVCRDGLYRTCARGLCVRRRC